MKFIVEDGTDEICIGGYGNDLGNKGLLKYTEEEIAKMIIENNNTNDNVRLANSLLRTIRNQDNIIKEVREMLEHKVEFHENLDFYEDKLLETHIYYNFVACLQDFDEIVEKYKVEENK